MELKYLNYDSAYSVQVNDRLYPFKHAICFGDVFRDIRITKNDICVYKIWINRSKEYVKDGNRDNYCFFTHEQLYNHIKAVKRLFDFKFTIKESEDHFDVTVTIQASPIYHKYLLTWIRYSYECPMNVMFVDINLLQKENIFKFVSKANLYLLLSYADWYNHRNVHSIVKTVHEGYRPGKMLSNAKLIEKLTTEFRLNDIYSGDYNFKYKINAVYDTDIDKIINSFPDRRNIYIDYYLKHIKK